MFRLRSLLAAAWPLGVFACSAGGADRQGTVSSQGNGGTVGSGGGTQIVQGSGGIGGTTSTGSGGQVTVGTQPPPSAPLTAPDGAVVLFDWPQGPKTDAGTCKAGHYKGTFSCTYSPPLPDGGLAGTGGAGATSAFAVTGPVEFDLTQSQNGEYLEVNGGTLNGSTFVITFTGDISGKLDCLTHKFDGMVTNGEYGILPFPPGGFFEGPTTADYSTTGPALVNGTWLFTVLDLQNKAQGTCPGTWSAAYVP